MRVVKYSRPTTERCQFEEWDDVMQCLTTCSKQPCVGRIGGKPYCEEHFSYGSSVYDANPSVRPISTFKNLEAWDEHV